MKYFVLLAILFSSSLFCHAQVNSLPSGKYESTIKTNQSKWDKGDIILLDDSKYQVSSSNEIGEYRFSAAAQRVFFTSGPLKSFYAKTSLTETSPIIVLPLSENAQLGLKIPAEIWCYHKQ